MSFLIGRTVTEVSGESMQVKTGSTCHGDERNGRVRMGATLWLDVAEGRVEPLGENRQRRLATHHSSGAEKIISRKKGTNSKTSSDRRNQS
jgi:hypothetical protein